MRRAFGIALILIAVGCTRKPAIPANVITRVNDRTLTLADFKRYAARDGGHTFTSHIAI